MLNDTQVSFSGVQPTGNLTIGNYLGAIRNFPYYSEKYKCFYCVVDMHAMTVRQVPAELRRRTYGTLALYIACGLDPEKNTLYVQSHVPAHAELAWILNCFTMFGELGRMTQFKDKSARHSDNINAGLFTYPVLMAADILLYQTDVVPVGIDQKQHVELTRDIAERFNQVYSGTFTIPEPVMAKTGTKIASLCDPTKKMSKSDENQNAVVYILDDKDTMIRKFRRAVTDSENLISFKDGGAGIKNLMTIYSCFTGKDYDHIEQEFRGIGYGEFKTAVGEACADTLIPIQERYRELLSDKSYLEGVMKKGSDEAAYYARKTLSKVKKKIGFVI